MSGFCCWSGSQSRFTLTLAMQCGEVAADMVLFRLGERNIQFSRVVFEIVLVLNSLPRLDPGLRLIKHEKCPVISV